MVLRHITLGVIALMIGWLMSRRGTTKPAPVAINVTFADEDSGC